MKNLSIFKRLPISTTGGKIAGAFTYVCLLLINTIKTKLRTPLKLYKNTFNKYDKWSEEELLGVLSNEAYGRALVGFGLG
ncbi:hypothetical protein NL676_008745 [Syzygium grande]|nr:hypothetical protein NL676_008745 [Syzygium grande]